MSEDLQSILEKINREGVEKAEAQAAAIIADAKAQAAALVERATAEAAARSAAAESAAKDFAARAEASVAQAARDVMLKLESAIAAKFERLLIKDVDRSLAEESVVKQLVSEAVAAVVKPVEVVVNPRLAAMLKAQLAAEKEIMVVTDEALASGFTIKLDGGRVEHSFTGAMIAAELAKRLRPELVKLLK